MMAAEVDPANACCRSPRLDHPCSVKTEHPSKACRSDTGCLTVGGTCFLFSERNPGPLVSLRRATTDRSLTQRRGLVWGSVGVRIERDDVNHPRR